MEYSRLPKCCKKKLKTIYRILESGDVAADVLSIAQSISSPSRGVKSVYSILWKLTLMGTSYAVNSRKLRKKMRTITYESIRKLIKLHIIVDHHPSKDEKLIKYWKKMLRSFKVLYDE